jgi:hypothetical protein
MAAQGAPGPEGIADEAPHDPSGDAGAAHHMRKYTRRSWMESLR